VRLRLRRQPAAARQREDNRELILVARERARELPTGIRAINKWHRCSASRIGARRSVPVRSAQVAIVRNGLQQLTHRAT
jgi:hypothetical protein